MLDVDATHVCPQNSTPIQNVAAASSGQQSLAHTYAHPELYKAPVGPVPVPSQPILFESLVGSAKWDGNWAAIPQSQWPKAVPEPSQLTTKEATSTGRITLFDPNIPDVDAAAAAHHAEAGPQNAAPTQNGSSNSGGTGDASLPTTPATAQSAQSESTVLHIPDGAFSYINGPPHQHSSITTRSVQLPVLGKCRVDRRLGG